MTESNARPILNVYIDDSGTRHPDHAKPSGMPHDWFALGGIIASEDDEAQARRLHAEFCQKWNIDYPLHSVKIRNRSEKFSWLKTMTKEDVQPFYNDLEALMIGLPVMGHACVIDRTGYHNRYFEKYGRQRWQLCKTAFSVLCERVAKLARDRDCRIRLYVEEGDRDSDRCIKEYFKELCEVGMPFAKDHSDKYGPLDATELKFRLVDLKFKRKQSPMMQLADMYLYPMCRGPYDPAYLPAQRLNEHKKLIDHVLAESDIGHMGIKYSCFDDADSKKGSAGEPSCQPPNSETS